MYTKKTSHPKHSKNQDTIHHSKISMSKTPQPANPPTTKPSGLKSTIATLNRITSHPKAICTKSQLTNKYINT